MKIKEIFLGHYVAPLLVLATVFLLTAISSKAESITDFFSKIRSETWLAIIVGVLLWVFLIAIFKRHKQIKAINNGGPLGFVIRNPLYGWTKIGEFTYEDMIWYVQAPTPPPFDMYQHDTPKINPGDVEIVLPPRCPNCKTELEEKKTFLGKYEISCPRCNFSIKKKESYYRYEDKVKKIVKREIELQNSQ